MNDNTILRIKVPAHLYESVKKQLTFKESKKRITESISGTEEELKAFYEKVKQMEAEGTDLESAIQYAIFDINNPDAAKELSMNEAKKQNFGAGFSVVKEKKATEAKKDMTDVVSDYSKDIKSGKESGKTHYSSIIDANKKAKNSMKDLDKGAKKKAGELDEWVGLNPADYDLATIAGLSVPVLTILLAAGQQKLGPLYDKVKAILAKKKEVSEKKSAKAGKENLDEWVGLNPADYDMTTLLGLSIPILTALLSIGQQKLGPAYDKIKSVLAKKKAGK